MEAQYHSVGMGAAVGQGLLDGLFHQLGRMVMMQLQDTHELSDATTVGPLLPQTGQELLVDR
jgi:hypothetical protein